MSEYQWELKQLDEQRKLFYAVYNETQQSELKSTQSTNKDNYIFMTTVSMPVFDRSENEVFL